MGEGVREKLEIVLKKVVGAVRTLSVEPVAFLFMFCKSMATVIVQNLTMEKACRHRLNLTEDACRFLQEEIFDSREDTIQRIASDQNMYRHVIEHLLGFLFVLFLGPWSDRNGRKIPLIVVIVSQLLQMTGNFVNAFFMDRDTSWILVLRSIPYSMGGTTTCLLVSAFSYMADVTDEKTRTARLSITNGMFFAGHPLGSLSGAFLYRHFGYLGVFGVAMGVCAINILYSILVLRDDTHKLQRGEASREGDDESNRKFFDPMYIMDVLRALFRKRPFQQRTILLVLGATIFISIIPVTGESNVEFLFTWKQFHWNEVSYSLYSSYSTIITTVGGTFMLVPLLSYGFLVTDAMIGGVGVTLDAFCRLCLAFSWKSWHFYAATPLAVLSTAKGAISRSLISKTASNDELGKIFAIVASAEAMIPILASPIYSKLYSATLDVFIGAFYLLSSALLFLVGTMFLYIFLVTRKQNISSTEENV